LLLPQEAFDDPQDPSAPDEPFSGPGTGVHHHRNPRSSWPESPFMMAKKSAFRRRSGSALMSIGRARLARLLHRSRTHFVVGKDAL